MRIASFGCGGAEVLVSLLEKEENGGRCTPFHCSGFRVHSVHDFDNGIDWTVCHGT